MLVYRAKKKNREASGDDIPLSLYLPRQPERLLVSIKVTWESKPREMQIPGWISDQKREKRTRGNDF